MKRELLDRSILLDAQDRAALRAELVRLGLVPTIEADGLFRVSYAEQTAQELIARIDTPLSVLRIHEPSLEEAYVELLRQPEEDVA
jgi:ABC-2 type transport system ATP-binding protein